MLLHISDVGAVYQTVGSHVFSEVAERYTLAGLRLGL
jgi:hypothetical protein